MGSSAGSAMSHLPLKATDGKDIPGLPRNNVESRKPARRLVRPRLSKPEETQGDVEMSEVEGSNIMGKAATSHNAETQGNLTQLGQPLARKRLASTTELREESLSQREPSSDVPAPVLKKSKGPDSSPGDIGGQSTSPLENYETLPTTEECVEAFGDLAQGSNEEAVEAEKEEVDNTGEKPEELKESQQVDTSEAELHSALEENLDRPTGVEMTSDDGSKDHAEQENQQLTMESESEREEGELMPDVNDIERTVDVSNVMGSPEIELQPEPVSTPVVSPARIEDEAPASEEPLEAVNDDKNDEGDGTEENAEGLEKSDGNDQTTEEAYQAPEGPVTTGGTSSASSTGEPDILKQPSDGVTTAEVKQASPAASNASNIVNLRERARERAMQRQAGAIPSTVSRGRGRPAGRGRGSRSGRGQNSGQQ